MFKKISIGFLMVALVFSFASCGLKDNVKKSSGIIIGEGEIEKQELQLKDFSSIDISKDYQVSVKKGKEFKVDVQTNKNIFEHLKIYVDGETLYAQYKEGVLISETKIQLSITMPELQNMNLSNDSIVKLQDKFQWDGDSQINLENDSQLSGEFSTKNLVLTLENDSRVNIKGEAEQIQAKGVNDTFMNMGEFKVKNGSLYLKSDARCELTVEENLDVTILGDAVFKYYGDGKIKETEVDEDAKIIKGQ